MTAPADFLDRLEATLAAWEHFDFPALPGRRNDLHAGVLVPIVQGPRGASPEVILTERPSDMRNHPGEICFPGGRPEPGDADLLATALREAEEEIGLGPARVLGRLSSMPLYTSEFRLRPFVAAASEPERIHRRSPSEVHRIHRLALMDLITAETILGVPWTFEGERLLSPIFEAGDRFVFGGTAEVLRELIEVVARTMGEAPPTVVAGPYTWEDVLPGLDLD